MVISQNIICSTACSSNFERQKSSYLHHTNLTSDEICTDQQNGMPTVTHVSLPLYKLTLFSPLALLISHPFLGGGSTGGRLRACGGGKVAEKDGTRTVVRFHVEAPSLSEGNNFRTRVTLEGAHR